MVSKCLICKVSFGENAKRSFHRAEKSEILKDDEMQIADQKIDYLRGAITSILKKISPNGPISEFEKCMKKTMEYQLGTTLIDESKQLKECQLFQLILKDSGLIEQQLGRETAEHELKVEELVYIPLQNILDNEFPSVFKYKHALRKYCLDKDSASNRYNASKKETVKGDLEEADYKVEHGRDILAIEMFNILSKENEMAEYILQLLKLQRGYHESALKNLETVIPQLEKKIGDSCVRKVFGTSLKEHLRITGKRIAYPLEVCIYALLNFGMLEEGLFRVGGSSAKIKRLKLSIDSGCFSVLIPEYRDAHVLANLLKLYLRELPEPLLTFNLQTQWIQAMQYQGVQKLETVKNIIEKLPQENKDNLSYLIQFLSKLSQYPENKMTASNIAIVLSPNLLWCKDEDESANMGKCVLINMLIEYFIKEVEVLFPHDMSQYVTLSHLFLEENTKVNKLNYNLKPESPRPHIRKKKSAPIPPNSSSKIDQDILVQNCNTNKKDLDDLLSNTYFDGDNSDPEFANIRQKNSSEKYENNCLEMVSGEYPQLFGEVLERKKTILNSKVPMFKQDIHKSEVSNTINCVSEEPVKDYQCVDNRNSVVKTNKLKMEQNDHLGHKSSLNRPTKPEIPARPVSLTKKLDTDSGLKKTHCSFYKVADKMHPSIINIQRNTDTSTTYKDTQLDAKLIMVPNNEESHNFVKGDINYDYNETSTKFDNNKNKSIQNYGILEENQNKTKSNEQINYNVNINYKKRPSHIRAKSEGGIMDIQGDTEKSNLQVLSKNLNKPTQPPPPPPDV